MEPDTLCTNVSKVSNQHLCQDKGPAIKVSAEFPLIQLPKCIIRLPCRTWLVPPLHHTLQQCQSITKPMAHSHTTVLVVHSSKFKLLSWRRILNRTCNNSRMICNSSKRMSSIAISTINTTSNNRLSLPTGNLLTQVRAVHSSEMPKVSITN